MDQHASKLPPKALSDEALRWIVRLHSGAETEADRRAFAAWRAASAGHEAAAREAEALWGDAADLQQDRETGFVRPGRAARRAVPRGSVLGALLLLAAVGALWSGGAFRGLLADHVTGTGETRMIELADGSRVYLNARSAIDVTFTPTARRVTLLEGEAFFEVAPEASRIFEVEAGEATVTAMGTAFDIDRTLPDGSAVTTVTEHAVVVATPSHDGAQSRVTLSEGQAIAVDGAGQIGTIRPRSAEDATAWRKGLYVAEGRPLGDVLAVLGAYQPGWILAPQASVRELRVNAVLDLKRPQDALDALAKGLPIVVRRLSPYVTLVSSR